MTGVKFNTNYYGQYVPTNADIEQMIMDFIVKVSLQELFRN